MHTNRYFSILVTILLFWYQGASAQNSPYIDGPTQVERCQLVSYMISFGDDVRSIDWEVSGGYVTSSSIYHVDIQFWGYPDPDAFYIKAYLNGGSSMETFHGTFKNPAPAQIAAINPSPVKGFEMVKLNVVQESLPYCQNIELSWEKSYDNVTWTKLADYSGPTVQDNEYITKTTYYRRKATSETVDYYSNTLSVSPVSLLQGGTIGYHQQIQPGGTAAPVSNVLLPTGGNSATYVYSWESSEDDENWQTIVGASGSGYQPPASANTKYYRRKIVSGIQSRYSNVVLVLVNGTTARNIPASATQASTQPVITIPAYQSLTAGHFNTITQHFVTQPGITTEAQLLNATPGGKVSRSVHYADGMGRVIQSIAQQASVSGKDIVSVNVFDQFGRSEVDHLPYVAATTSQTTGTFRTDANTAQPNFLKTLMGADKNYFYSTRQSESGPQSRYSISKLPGNAYVGSNVSGKEELRFNTPVDAVRIWTIGDNAADYPVGAGVYSTGTLTVTTIVNPEGNRKREYRLKNGLLICSREYPSAITEEHQALTTYYVYNELNQIRCIIPPLAEKYSRQYPDFNASAATIATAKSLCYKFVYNERGDRISQQQPGAEFEDEFIFDARGRLVFSRNAQLRSRNLGEWVLTLYDPLDRPVIIGLYKNASATYTSLQTLVNQSSGVTQVQLSTPAPIHLMVDSRDGQPSKYEAKESITFTAGFESETNASFDAIINPSMSSNAETFTVSNPVPGVSGYEILTVLYFDNYNWPGVKGFNTSFQLDAGSNLHSLPATPRSSAFEMLTGFKTKVIGQDKMLTSVIYYDDKGNPIQFHKENIAGGWDVITRQFDFSGKLLSGYVHHKNPESTSNPETKIGFSNAYTPSGRPIGSKHRIYQASGILAKDLTSYTYDEVGRLIRKNLGSIESLEYSYTPLGQLAGINAGYAQSGTGGHYFGQILKYDEGFQKSRRDGMISGTQWRRFGNPEEYHAYGYDYDGGARLTKADYSRQAGAIWDNIVADYDVKIPSYDENGNILKMKQNGMLLGNVKTELDDLTYQYGNGGFSNKLLKVTDVKGDQHQGDFKDVNDAQDDYSYDKDGNIIRDRNRGISITYDYLISKPIKITFDADPAKSIEYVYTINGEKLRQVIKDASGTTTYTYVNGFVYKNDVLQMFPHQQGRVRRNMNGTFVYDYFIHDNLGNIRTVLTEESNIAYYKATHEDNPQPAAPVVQERDAFHFPPNVDVIQAGHKFYDYNGINRKFVKLNSGMNGRKIGTSKVLRVMAGDKVETGVYYYYQQNSPGNNVPNDPVNGIVSALVNVMLGPATTVIPNGHNNLVQSSANQQVLNTADFSSFISSNQQQQPASQVPKAYLNYALFDDNFKLITGGVQRVQTPDAVTPLAAQININKNGYLYVYVSNESPTDVCFDDLVVKHTTGPLLQEDTYYPFGLGIRALSAKALNRLVNKYLFNGIELIDDHDLEIYDAEYRNLDPQIGRWWQRDPMTEKYNGQSPWSLSGNNPVNFADPLGDDYFRDIRGNVKWINSNAAYEVSNGVLFENIGPWFSFRLNGAIQTYYNDQLYSIESTDINIVPGLPVLVSYTEYATPYFKGQEQFVKFTSGLAANGLLPKIRESIFKHNLAREATYARGIYGGLTPEAIDRIRIQSDLQMLPTLREIYAAMYPGRDPNLTILTNEEAKAKLYSTTELLVLSWVPHIAMLRTMQAPAYATLEKPMVKPSMLQPAKNLPTLESSLATFSEGRNVAMASDKGFKTLAELGLTDGMSMSSSRALEMGEAFLGKGYTEVGHGTGRFVSADGQRVFRMGVNDITGAHGGGPHVNFETLIPNPLKPGKMKIDMNFHIYLIN
ncbi:DUF6443 domain-containing protein [Chitinophaga rhizosphaerae]|uniref:DUF6443 domain-containing protein n=1 Tax=Chitinophaga rhizosphaerae TaxID=1864947 RepID=UPI000F80140E|nr:DUF6443 domain-containing protein [Chitinophaga rhizosphaerae]